MSAHLTMEQLLATRDGDRSQPEYAQAFEHLRDCPACQAELERLHQRTARLRALPPLEPARDLFPMAHSRFIQARNRRRHVASLVGLATAASLLVAVVGRDLFRPQALGAEVQLAHEISRSQELETALHEWRPANRVVDGRTAIVVIELEDRIASLDSKLADAAQLASQQARVQEQLKLWQERVALMKALVDVHVTRASNVGL